MSNLHDHFVRQVQTDFVEPEFSGTLIRDQIAAVERIVEAELQLDPTEAVLRGSLYPAMYLADVKKYLSLMAAIDSGDEAAWWAVHSVQECLFTGLTEECFFCGQMEGQHAEWTGRCPDGGTTVFRMIGLDYGPEMEQYRRKVS